MSRTACTVTIVGDQPYELPAKVALDLIGDAIADRYPDATPTIRHIRLDRFAVAVTVIGLDALVVAGVLDGYAHRHPAARFEGINGWSHVVGISGYDAGKAYDGSEAPDHIRNRPAEFVR